MTGFVPNALNPAPVTSPIGRIHATREGQPELAKILKDARVMLDPYWTQYFTAKTPIGAIGTGTNAERSGVTAASYPGWIYFETDRGLLYISRTATGTVSTNGTTVTWEGGDLFASAWESGKITINGVSYTISAVAASAKTLTLSSTAGVQTLVAYSVAIYGWYYAAGAMATTLAALPTNLDVTDYAVPVFLPEYSETLTWDGFAWFIEGSVHGTVSFAFRAPYTHEGTVDTVGTAVAWKTGPKFNPKWGTVNRIRIAGAWYAIASYDSLETLTLASSAGTHTGLAFQFAIGWHFCDGKGDNNAGGGNVSVLNSNGTASALVVPDLTTGPYFKGATAAGAATVPAVAPTLSGNTADESAHTHSVTVDIAPFTASVNLGPFDSFAAGGIGGVTDTHAHTIDPPSTTVISGAGTAHHHGVGTLVVSATAEPLSMALEPWLRK